MKGISYLAGALAVTLSVGFALADVKVLSYQSPGTFSIVGTPGHELSKDLATEMNEIGGPGEKTFNGDGTALTIQKISGDGNVTLNRFKNIVIIQKTGRGELHVNDCKSVSIAKLDGSGRFTSHVPPPNLSIVSEVKEISIFVANDRRSRR